MPFIQHYTPFNSLFAASVLAAVPFALLCWQLLIRRAKGHIAALTALAGTLILALGLWHLPPDIAVRAALYGASFAVFPILWIIVSAMWLYTMTVDSGQFAVVRASISAMTDDRRIQAIFIAFAFGALLESTAGYGAPVAIGAAMLIGLGFAPVQAAGLCLLANTVPVAYAGMGLPALVAAQVSELDPFRVSQIVGLHLPVLAFFMPLWISVLVCGWRRSWEIWPVLLAGGLGSSVPTWMFAQYHGYTLPGIMGALGSLVSLGLLLRWWKPASIFRFSFDPPHEGARESLPTSLIFRAWLPWLVLVLFVVLVSNATVRAALNALWYAAIPWPGLHQQVFKAAPLVAQPQALAAVFTFNPLSSPGTAIFAACLVAPLCMPGYSYRQAAAVLWRTCVQMRFSMLTVITILVLAQVMNYSGMSYTLGLALTHTGALFPIFSPVLGWIGVFLTGSDTSSNALFCGMQRTTAEAVGMDPYLTVAANTTGGVAAKMISPQSIAVAVGAAGMHGQEGALMRYTIGHSLLMLAMISLLTWLSA